MVRVSGGQSWAKRNGRDLSGESWGEVAATDLAGTVKLGFREGILSLAGTAQDEGGAGSAPGRVTLQSNTTTHRLPCTPGGLLGTRGPLGGGERERGAKVLSLSGRWVTPDGVGWGVLPSPALLFWAPKRGRGAKSAPRTLQVQNNANQRPPSLGAGEEVASFPSFT